MTSLERELMATAQRQNAARRPTFNLRAYRQFFPAKEAKEAPKQMNGVRMNPNGTLTIGDQTYSRAEFRAALEVNMREMRADPKSAFNDRRHPDHAQVVSEMQLGYKFLGGELTESDEKEIVTEWHEATQESSEVANPQPYQQIAEMWKDPAVRAAKQRRDAGARLDDREKEIMREYDRLELANNSQARKEQAGAGGWMKTTRPASIPSDLFALEKIQDPRERTFAIRELRSRWRDDKASPFNDTSHPEHRNYVGAMQRLYQEEEALGRQPEDPE